MVLRSNFDPFEFPPWTVSFHRANDSWNSHFNHSNNLSIVRFWLFFLIYSNTYGMFGKHCLLLFQSSSNRVCYKTNNKYYTLITLIVLHYYGYFHAQTHCCAGVTSKSFWSRINPNNDFVSSVIDFAWIISFDISSGHIFQVDVSAEFDLDRFTQFDPIFFSSFDFWFLIWSNLSQTNPNRFHLLKPPSQIIPRVQVGPSNSNKHLAGYCV